MAKPATKAATPAVKAKKAEPEANADGHVEINTDAPRTCALGDEPRVADPEGEAIKAAAKDHKPGEGPNVGEVDRPGRGEDLEDA